tara:strand:+ start:1384 stop:1494 length:111 start_codon:yes stop_codon:yes gene_type:complete
MNAFDINIIKKNINAGRAAGRQKRDNMTNENNSVFR